MRASALKRSIFFFDNSKNFSAISVPWSIVRVTKPGFFKLYTPQLSNQDWQLNKNQNTAWYTVKQPTRLSQEAHLYKFILLTFVAVQNWKDHNSSTQNKATSDRFLSLRKQTKDNWTAFYGQSIILYFFNAWVRNGQTAKTNCTVQYMPVKLHNRNSRSKLSRNYVKQKLLDARTST